MPVRRVLMTCLRRPCRLCSRARLGTREDAAEPWSGEGRTLFPPFGESSVGWEQKGEDRVVGGLF